tara:strand:- start:57 stop:530 length:474 start_codon:yes stop_codon:yes gene_type:complete
MKKDPNAEFKAFLEKTGSRYSAQKQQIANAIFNISSHFEIEDFIITMRNDGQDLSRATIYRTIKQLLEAKLIQKITTQEGKVLYERNIETQQHDHLICSECGSIFELVSDAITNYINQYCETIMFKPDYRSLHIYGVCKNCKPTNSSTTTSENPNAH